jgi:hypothetical protein
MQLEAMTGKKVDAFINHLANIEFWDRLKGGRNGR